MSAPVKPFRRFGAPNPGETAGQAARRRADKARARGELAIRCPGWCGGIAPVRVEHCRDCTVCGRTLCRVCLDEEQRPGEERCVDCGGPEPEGGALRRRWRAAFPDFIREDSLT